MGWSVLIAQVNSAWYDFLARQMVARIGIGCTFAPLMTVAMRSIRPMMAGTGPACPTPPATPDRHRHRHDRQSRPDATAPSANPPRRPPASSPAAAG
jgi:hypothetical protein